LLLESAPEFKPDYPEADEYHAWDAGPQPPLKLVAQSSILVYYLLSIVQHGRNDRNEKLTLCPPFALLCAP
jgi:hypothetical protein